MPVEEIPEAFLDSHPIPQILFSSSIGSAVLALSALATIASLCQILSTTEHTPAHLCPSLLINSVWRGIDPTPSSWAVPEEATSAAAVDTPLTSHFI